MEEQKIIETIDSKLSEHKEHFESQKSDLQESVKNNYDEFVQSMEKTTEILESNNSKFEEVDSSFNSVVEVLESLKSKVDSLESQLQEAKADKGDEEGEDEDEDDMKAKEKKMKKYAEELGYEVSKPKVSQKENFETNEGDFQESGNSATKMSIGEFLKSKEFKEKVKNLK